MLNQEVVTKYKQLVIDDDRNIKKRIFWIIIYRQIKEVKYQTYVYVKTSTSFGHQMIDKTKFLALIKPLMNSRTKVSKRKKQIQQNAIIIQDHNKETISLKTLVSIIQNI